jgi:hypothetical protein
VDDDLLKWDGFDDAILGVGSRCGMDDILVYSKKKMAYILRDRDDMDVEEAIEYRTRAEIPIIKEIDF